MHSYVKGGKLNTIIHKKYILKKGVRNRASKSYIFKVYMKALEQFNLYESRVNYERKVL